MKYELCVLLATHNGAKWIGRMLDAYAAQDFDLPWQMIVVDNRSTDGTAGIVRSYSDRLPLEFLSEDRVGKNAALNTGLKSVDAELVILTDDDAPPAPGFLAAWSQLNRSYSDYDLFGGRVVAQFEVPPPNWIQRLTKASSAVFAQRDLPTGPVAADEIFGPNMCVRRKIFNAGITFNENIGPNGTDAKYPMGSETDFCRRAAAAGFKAFFFAEPVVGHIVRPNQMTFDYFKTVAYRAGRRDAMLAHEAGALSANLWAEHRWRRHVPAWLQKTLLKFRAWLSFDLVERNFRWWRYHWWRGYMNEARKLFAAPH